MTIRAAFAALFFLTGTAFAAPAPKPTTPEPITTEPGHEVSPTNAAHGAVTRQQFEARFETGAVEFAAGRTGVQADRFAAFDIAWPRDAEESKRLGGNAVIVIGALSQNVAELPLAKAYLERPDGSQVVLKRLGLVKKTLKAPSQAAKIFGPNVSEEFYLVPASVLGRGAMLKCDFAKNRLGFVLSQSLSLPKGLVARSSTGQPAAGALQAIVSREYPGFGVTITDSGK